MNSLPPAVSQCVPNAAQLNPHKCGNAEIASIVPYKLCILFKVVCIGFYESSLETDAVGTQGEDGSHDHGLFQVLIIAQPFIK